MRYGLFAVLLVACLLLSGCDNGAVSMATEDFVVEDFSDSLANWEFITDGVMGGISTGQMDFVDQQADGKSLRMQGKLSLENNGGFIQVRRPISKDSKYFDARGYTGVKLEVKGDGNEYAVHLRSRGTWLPWQYYEAKFPTNGDWQTVILPFGEFKPYFHKRKLNTAKLTTVAIVALKKEFEPDIYLRKIVMAAYQDQDGYNELTEQEKYVILDKGTERPFTGKYYMHFDKGVYRCRRCGAELFSSDAKFKSGCGWPAFDDELPNSVRKQPDADGVRTEIVCANCGGHLGHIFYGEGLTEKDTRYCVNSVSIDFQPNE